MTVKIGVFKAFDFEQSVKAKKLKNSRGSKQDRIHILGYEGRRGKDPKAVAASRMQFSSDNDAKLGWWDRKFCVLHKEDGVWYKVNINSFKKRINPTNSLIIDANGVCINLKEVIPAIKKSAPDVIHIERYEDLKDHAYKGYNSNGEYVDQLRKRNNSIEDLKIYCKDHEVDIITKLQELNVPQDVLNLLIISVKSSFEDLFSIPARTLLDHWTRTQIRGEELNTLWVHASLPLSKIVKNLQENLLAPYDLGAHKREDKDLVFSMRSREIDSHLTAEENFSYLLTDLTTAFSIWYHSIKTIIDYSENDVFGKYILESDPWNAFKFKDSWTPEFFKNGIDFSASFDNSAECQNITLKFHLYFHFHQAYHPIGISAEISSPSPSFEALFEVWKDKLGTRFKEFLDETSLKYSRNRLDDFLDSLHKTNLFSFEFNELDELLELNGEMTALDNAKKHPELKDLLKQKGRAALLKWHPDKALQNGLDPIICGEMTIKLNDLLKQANEYVDSKI